MAASIDELAAKLRDKDRQINDLIKKCTLSALNDQPDLKEHSEEEIKKSLIENEETAKRYSITQKDNIFHNAYLYGDSIAEEAKLIADVKFRMINREDEIDLVLYAARYHDCGKITLANILIKPGDISRQEFAEIQKHSEYGANMIKSCYYPRLLIGHHHENWDGTGYPDHKKGSDIPLGARVIRIPDSYNAMTNDRKYQKAFSPERALETIKKNSGKLFDPELVEIFISEMTKTPSKDSKDSGNGKENPKQ
jgi:HD-GYP domain-containing protein (c-di-GMP phosphodiesterase class II)